MSMVAGFRRARRKIVRGNVYFLNLGQSPGLELHGIRAGIIISHNSHNFSRLASLVRVVPLTLPNSPGYGDELLIEPPHNGLPVPTLVHVLQTRAVDRRCIRSWLGRFSAEAMREVERRLLEMDGIAISQAAEVMSEDAAELAVAS
jgi:mRNA-degrading endonuclease toxin of MazEF toxin-antitoxin module